MTSKREFRRRVHRLFMAEEDADSPYGAAAWFASRLHASTGERCSEDRVYKWFREGKNGRPVAASARNELDLRELEVGKRALREAEERLENWEEEHDGFGKHLTEDDSDE